MLRKNFFTIVFLSWMMFITFSSLYSFSAVGKSSLNIPHLDKAVHFTFYFVACVLGVLFLREQTKGMMNLKKAILIMLFTTIAFGIVIELIQYGFTTSRTGDVVDGIANTLGSFCGAFTVKSYFLKDGSVKWKL